MGSNKNIQSLTYVFFSRMFLHIIGALQILKVNCTLTLKCSKILNPRPWINWDDGLGMMGCLKSHLPVPRSMTGQGLPPQAFEQCATRILGVDVFESCSYDLFLVGYILSILSILTSYAGFGFWCCDMLFYSTMETLVNQSNEMRVFSSLICVSYIYILYNNILHYIISYYSILYCILYIILYYSIL